MLLLAMLAAASPAMPKAQDAPNPTQGPETAASIARLLTGRKASVELTVKGKVKRKIKLDVVLLHTSGHGVGRPTPRADLGPNVPENAFSAETTAEGNIEAETGPITNK